MYAAVSYTSELVEKTNAVREVIHLTPATTPAMAAEAERISTELSNILFMLNGPVAKASDEEIPPMDMPLVNRLGEMASASYETSGDITPRAKEQLDILRTDFPPVMDRIKKAGQDLQALDKQLDSIKAPWTPGRIPSL
jgi:hypothetical protein